MINVDSTPETTHGMLEKQNETADSVTTDQYKESDRHLFQIQIHLLDGLHDVQTLGRSGHHPVLPVLRQAVSVQLENSVEIIEN